MTPNRWPKVREIVFAVLTEEREAVIATLRRAVRTSPRRTIQILELAARLGFELGPQADAAGLVRIVINTNVPLDTMKAPPPLSLPSRGGAAPEEWGDPNEAPPSRP